MSTHRWATLAAMLLASCGASAPPAEPAEITETASSDDESSRDTEPSAAPAAIASDGLRWELVATPPRLTMAERSTFRLTRRVTNTGSAAADAMHASASFTMNGASSMELDMAFGNGARSSEWAALAPGRTVEDARDMGESLFATPGDYVIAMSTDGVTASVTVRVDP